MNTKRKLNCYVFSNLMISLLSLNMITNNNTANVSLVKKVDDNNLNKIYEKGVTSNLGVDTIISSEAPSSNVITISNKVMQSQNNNYTDYSYVKPSYNSLTGENVVKYAKRYLGLRYVSAGRSLATGTDCSGFTSLIYQEFGITLGKTVSSQLYSGTYVSREDLMPGDLVFYSYGGAPSHVTIYIGDGLIIHESNPRDGVKISSINIMTYVTARRVITADVISNTEESTKVVEVKEPEVINTPEVITGTENVSTEEIIPKEDNNKEEKTEETETDVNLEIVEEPKEEERKVIEENTSSEETIEKVDIKDENELEKDA